MIEAMAFCNEEGKHITGDAHNIDKLVRKLSAVENMSAKVFVELHKEYQSEWWNDKSEDESEPSFICAKKIHEAGF
jgi:hypothetical protein